LRPARGFPAFDRGGAQDAVWRVGPSDIEQGSVNSVARIGFEYSRAIQGMSCRLLRRDESCSEYGAVSAERERSSASAAVGETTRSDHRQVADRVPDLGDQGERSGGAADVAAGLEALSHHCIYARFVCPAGFISVPALPYDLYPRSTSQANR